MYVRDQILQPVDQPSRKRCTPTITSPALNVIFGTNKHLKVGGEGHQLENSSGYSSGSYVGVVRFGCLLANQ